MKPLLPLLAATFAGLLAGCSSWPGNEVSQAQYLPMRGGPGYGPMGPRGTENVVPGGPAPATAQVNSDAEPIYGGGGYGAVGGAGYQGTGGSGMSNPTGNVGGGSSGSEETGSAGTTGASGSSAAGAASSGAALDQQSMCELQRRVTAAHTPEERQALMEQAMPGMSQDARERRLQMMRESCQ